MILGHKKEIYFLKTIFNSKKIPQSLLFTGPEGIGKKKIALEVVALILGENFKNHPDLFLLEPKEKILISQMREFLTKFSLKPIKSDTMVGIIDNAHLMTEEAQQCFLKTLEEPKTKALFILITAHPNLLLSTILSRCQKINFSILNNEEMLEFVKKIDNLEEKEKQIIIEIAAGRPGVLFNFLSAEKKGKILKDLALLPKLPIIERFHLAKKIAESGKSNEILLDWLNFFHYLFLKKIKEKKVATTLYSLEKVKNILEEIQKTIFFLSNTNIKPRSAIEILLLKF